MAERLAQESAVMKERRKGREERLVALGMQPPRGSSGSGIGGGGGDGAAKKVKGGGRGQAPGARGGGGGS